MGQISEEHNHCSLSNIFPELYSCVVVLKSFCVLVKNPSNAYSYWGYLKKKKRHRIHFISSSSLLSVCNERSTRQWMSSHSLFNMKQGLRQSSLYWLGYMNKFGMKPMCELL